MKKKMLIIVGSIVVLFAALYFVIDYKNQQATGDGDNPYGTDDLHQATIDQLDNPNYQNQILPDELQTKLDNGEDMMVYYYDPTCPHCQELTPRLIPIVEDMGVDMKKLNLLEFESAWRTYGIESTPTLVYFENGEEVDRVNGAQSDDIFRAFFNEYATDDSGSSDEQAN
ncbi:thiol reductase thioredoxin [Lentibacillus kapialis]|uniref:Thioredoxin n=1 Tax=Lentibacillus kapialis TaxID=340214 RepID=A0A917PU86_9BACI|nr:thioredoxin family protein [Lentibacillus kapialis]GGJ92144.1 thiol reductase thioredoxin [Lentibacillus kapialis]